MLENTIKVFTTATFLAGLLFCGQSLLLGQDNQSTDLFKTVEIDDYSEGLDTIRIKAGPFGKTMQFNVDRLSDPSKPTWSSFDGEWKARVEEFPEEPHLAKWQGKLLSVWRSPAGVTFFLLDMVKVRNENLSWFFVRSDRLERPLAYFPEAMLEEAISEVLGIDPARLTKKLLADRLVSFELNDADVRDLTGLGDAKNLQVLTLRDNLITDLSPLAGLSKLRRLELRGNRLESLESFKDLPALVELNLSQNRLNGLSGVEGLTILRKLDVSENDLRDLTGVSTLKNLETLHAQENRLGLVEPFKDQNKNAKFDVGEEFEDLNGNGQWDNDPLPELNDLRALRDLYLYGNSLKTLSGLGSLPSLRTLLLGGNEISDASPLRKYVSLNNLSLNRNQVSDLGQFADLNYLIYLDLAENRLSDLRPLRN
ncbi:MAG: leucine-rich repeat domain-containing protein, partial [Opitutales bacterium]